MGYYMQYLFEEEPEVRLDSLEGALKEIDDKYAFVDWDNDGRSAEIRYDGEVYGAFDLETIGEIKNPLPPSGYSPLAGGELDEEIQELIEEVEAVKGWFVKKPKDRVLAFLRQVRVRLVVRVLWGGREAEETLAKLDPIWEWLMANHKGLLYAEGEGYYEGRKLILKVK